MHIIRLRGPWQKTLLGDSQPIRTTVPESGVGHPVGASYRRSFNSPTGIENAQVNLNIDSWGGRLDGVSLNNQQLTTQSPPFRGDVTELLQPHNTLIVHLTEDDQGAILDGEVYLTIREENEA